MLRFLKEMRTDALLGLAFLVVAAVAVAITLWRAPRAIPCSTAKCASPSAIPLSIRLQTTDAVCACVELPIEREPAP